MKDKIKKSWCQGYGEHCQSCGRAYLTIYQLPNKIWKLISPKKSEAGLLCPKCADDKARDIGIELFWSAKTEKF